ncbi:GSCOCG00012388001-RA-CDS, partial [Cotesia congregata]
HEFDWSSETIPYENVKDIFDIIVKDKSYIYVKGSAKKQWLETMFGHKKLVINLEQLDCPPLNTLQQNYPCSFKKFHKFTDSLCAFNNVICLKDWFIKNCVDSSFKRSIAIYYQLYENINYMSAEDIAFLPKDFILHHASDQIDRIWKKLPEELQTDDDILKYRRCRKHFLPTAIDYDEFDCLIPYVKDCHFCNN